MQDLENNIVKKIYKLKQFQRDFVLSTARYPAFVAGWGTGKTLCGIIKMLKFCNENPGTLFLCLRKEWEDLRDSTVKDFESITGYTVPSSRDIKMANGSTIMFRHIEELNNLQNINLGGAWIEQAEELDSDNTLFLLIGRLRRPNSAHQIFLTANTRGHDWIYTYWKTGLKKHFVLFEGKTLQNKDNLPQDFLDSLEDLKKLSPARYRRFVENSWDDDDVQDVIIGPDLVREAVERFIKVEPPIKRIISIDVARMGSDRTVMYALENGTIIGKEELEKKNTMETVGYAMIFSEKNKNIQNFAVDEIGVGGGVVDRLRELGKKVVAVNSSAKAYNPKYKNIRAEFWGYGAEMFARGKVQLSNVVDEDEDLIQQLSWPKWKTITSGGQLQVESKDDIRERYKRSPDNADAFLMGLWGLTQVQDEYRVGDWYESKNNEKEINGWIGGSYVPIPPYVKGGGNKYVAL